MQENTNWYWKQQPLQHTIIVSPRTILHPQLDLIIIRYVQYIPKKRFSRNEAKNSIQRHPIIITDADYDYILDKIDSREILSLIGMLVLIVMMNSIDGNNNNAIFNVALHYILIKYQYVNIIWIFICFFLCLVAYFTVS